MFYFSLTRHILLALFLCLLITLDQITKFLIVSFLYQKIDLTSWFSLVLVYNSGISFGLFQEDSELMRWTLICITFSIACVITVMSFRESHPLPRFGFALISSGAFGNILDRLSSKRAVIDFIDLHINQWHWPAFNIADSLIFLGACCAGWHFIFSSQHVSQSKVHDA